MGTFVLSLLMIAIGDIADAVGWENAVLKFISDPVLAMLIGLTGTLIVGRVVVVKSPRPSGQRPYVAAACAVHVYESRSAPSCYGVPRNPGPRHTIRVITSRMVP